MSTTSRVPASVPSLVQSSAPVVGVVAREVQRVVEDVERLREHAVPGAWVDVFHEKGAVRGAVAPPQLAPVREVVRNEVVEAVRDDRSALRDAVGEAWVDVFDQRRRLLGAGRNGEQRREHERRREEQRQCERKRAWRTHLPEAPSLSHYAARCEAREAVVAERAATVVAAPKADAGVARGISRIIGRRARTVPFTDNVMLAPTIEALTVSPSWTRRGTLPLPR